MRTDIDQVSGYRIEPAACSAPQAGRLFAQHHAEPAIAQPDCASEPGEATTDNDDICFHSDTRTKCTTQERSAVAARSADVRGKRILGPNDAGPSCLLRPIAGDR